MKIYALSGILTFVTSFGFGVFSWIKGGKKLNRIWAIFCFCVAIWGLGCFKFSSTLDKDNVFLWLRIGHVGVILMPVFFFHFILEFLQQRRTKTLLFIYLLGVIFSALNLTDGFGTTNLLIAHLRFVFNEFYVDSPPAPLYPIFLTFYFGTIIYAHYYVLKHYKNASQLKKSQMKYFLIATVVGFAGGTTSFFMVFGIDIYPTFHMTVPLYPIIMTYAIVNYKLMDIEVIIKRTLIFTGIVGVSVGAIALPFAVIQTVIGKAFGIPNPFALMALGIATTVLIYRPVERVLAKMTDKYLFQKKFDYRKILKYASQGLSRVNSLRYQLKLITYFLTRRARIKTAAVYMPENENGENGKSDFILKEFRAFDASQVGNNRLAFDSQIITYLKKEKRKPYLEFYEVEDLVRRHTKDMSNLYRYDFGEIRNQMYQMKAFLIVPSYYQDRLQGILVLGEKRSEEPYTEEDITLFQTVAQETAIAFENARKHDKLVAQKEELEAANEKLREMQAEIIQAKEEAAVAELSGGISHDVNNGIYAQSDATERAKEALNYLSTVFTELYDSNRPISASQKIELFQYLEDTMVAVKQIEDASKHIEDVARTLSQIAKGERAQMSRLNLRTFIKGMIRIGALRTYSNRLRAQAFEEEPEVDMPNDLPPIWAHAQLLKGVFINLFKNAIDAMNNITPKKLRIAARRDEEDPNMVRIEFSDNGCGISKEHLPHIFDYEFTTKGAHGEGKGLFNVKSVIENQHQGKIEVESELGKGTTFILKIPVYQGQDNKDFRT